MTMTRGQYRSAATRGGVSTFPSLEARYEAYCQREASALLALVPREAVRTLYAEARDWALASGMHEGKEPMGTLLAFCRHLLPLPPFDLWKIDYRDRRLAYMELLSQPPGEPVASEPVTVALRTVEAEGVCWYASLVVGHDGLDWRGHMAFHADGAETPYRTAEIFVEDDLASVRGRFDGFTDATLVAFLRSTRP